MVTSIALVSCSKDDDNSNSDNTENATQTNKITIDSYSSGITNPQYGIDTYDDEFMVSFNGDNNLYIQIYIQGKSIPDADFSKTFSRNEISLDISNMPVDSDDEDLVDSDYLIGNVSISRSGSTWEINFSMNANSKDFKIYYKGSMSKDSNFG